MLMLTSCFRARWKTLKRMIYVHVEVPHGLGNSILPLAPEWTGMAMKGHSIITENRSFFWPFINEENPQRRSGHYSNYDKSQRIEDEYDTSMESESEDEYDSSTESETEDEYDSSTESDTEDKYDSSTESEIEDEYDSSTESDTEDKYDSSTESYRSESDLTKERLALGLSPYGPLTLDEVKIAYRACALKWHPDRHVGFSKVVAEEKFKLCSASYDSLCDKLGTN